MINPISIFYKPQFVTGAIIVPLLSTSLLITTAQAAQAGNWLSSRISALFEGDQAESQAAGRSRGGAVRGATCNAFNQIRPDATAQESLIALMPKTNESITIARYPTFWFYLPIDQSSEAVWTEFSMVDENDEPVLSQDPFYLKLPENPGLVSYTIPSTEAPLEVDKRYRWYFIVVCNETDYSINPRVEGWVKRIEGTDMAQQLAASVDAAPENRLSVYTDYSIWNETVSLLINNRENQPDLWMGLLKLFELGDINPDITAEPLEPFEPLEPLDQ